MYLLPKWPRRYCQTAAFLICQLECDVQAKKTEINDMHIKFAKHVDTILSLQNHPNPSYASTLKEGASSVMVQASLMEKSQLNLSM